MGRSRFQTTEDDPTQRSRRKKNAASGENLESASAGQGTSEGKRALYHCNYCNKDITGKIRIKCAMCPDFDLCIECVSVGAEVTPHKSNHPYRVMDNLSFPLICHDWNADEEILLLEGIEMYGMGNWAEVAEHVGTKSKEICIDHYKKYYLSSSFFPLPDMSHVMGKNRKELLAMAKDHTEDKKGFSLLPGDEKAGGESGYSPSRVKAEEGREPGVSGRASSSECEGTKVMHEGSSLLELSGYNWRRHEFDPEYDNEAELLLAEMEFKETDTEDEKELKLRVLKIYSKRLDERKRRKDFIMERNLMYTSTFESDLSEDERALCRRYDVFMRFHSKEDHHELLRCLVEEHRTFSRLQQLKEAQAAGCRTSAEAQRFIDSKRKWSLDAAATEEARLLSEPEKRLCCEISIAPPVYLQVQEMMTKQIFSGAIAKKTDAYSLFQLKPSQLDRVYDMLIKKGIALP